MKKAIASTTNLYKPSTVPADINQACLLPKNRAGWVVEGLLAALFVGLSLFIILFSWISTAPASTRFSQWGYYGVTMVIVLAMVASYHGISYYLRRRLQRGRRDHLMMRNMVETCLAKECGELEKRFSDPEITDVLLFNQILFFKVQTIIAEEDSRTGKTDTAFEEIRVRLDHNDHLGELCSTPEEYETLPLPAELATLFEALKPLTDRLHTQIFEIRRCRRTLFTRMGDYMKMMAVREADIKKVMATYNRPPSQSVIAEQIAFAFKTIDYFKGLNQNTLPPEKRLAMELLATAKIRQLKRDVKNYRDAWQRLRSAYDALPYC